MRHETSFYKYAWFLFLLLAIDSVSSGLCSNTLQSTQCEAEKSKCHYCPHQLRHYRLWSSFSSRWSLGGTVTLGWKPQVPPLAAGLVCKRLSTTHPLLNEAQSDAEGSHSLPVTPSPFPISTSPPSSPFWAFESSNVALPHSLTLILIINVLHYLFPPEQSFSSVENFPSIHMCPVMANMQ